LPKCFVAGMEKSESRSVIWTDYTEADVLQFNCNSHPVHLVASALFLTIKQH